MRSFFIVKLVVTFLLASVLVTAAPTCSSTVCNGLDPSKTTSSNGVPYCCPSSNVVPTIVQVSDPSTWTCPATQNCDYTTVAVATWSQPNCPGTSTFSGVTTRGASSNAQCLFNDALGEYITIRCSSSTSTFIVTEGAGCSGTSATYATTYGVNGDLACYNLKAGSILVDCTASGANKVGSTITSPPVTSQMFVDNGVTTAGLVANNTVAIWSDQACSLGSSLLSTAVSGTRCFFGYGAYYRPVCATNSATSAWSLRVWFTQSSSSANQQACQAGATPDQLFQGSGTTCTATAFGSFLIDCTLVHNNQYVNYLPPVDGVWTAWSTCSATCGGGSSTRSCSAPAPSRGGAACIGDSSQACNTQACSAGGGGSNSDSGSTSTGSQPAPQPGTSSTGSSASGSTYAASVVFTLTFHTASTDASFISTVQSNVATMASVSKQQVQVTTVSASGRRLLQASSQLKVTIQAASTGVAQAAYSQFQKAFGSTSTATNPLLAQSVNTDASPVAVYSATCADGSTKTSSSECGASNTNNNSAASSVASWLPLAVASAAVLFNTL
jgi:hypothetical protein